MIQVITTIELQPDCLEVFLAALSENVTKVKAEDGCLAYEIMMDVASGLPAQGKLRPNTVILVEAWDSLEALHAHVSAPNMAAFRKAAEKYVQGVSHRVLQPV